jgi:hypothetical protein
MYPRKILCVIRNVSYSDVEIVREVKRSRKLTCVYCKKKGASVTCNGEVSIRDLVIA